MSFFGLSQATAASPDFYGIADYASSMVFELVVAEDNKASSTVKPDDVRVRFKFANGTASDANPPRVFPLFGRAETLLPWEDFVLETSKFAIGTTSEWCTACGNTDGACAVSGAGVSTEVEGGRWKGVSAPVAGVIGALVTLVIILGLEGLVMGVGGLRLTKKSKGSLAMKASETNSEVSKV